MKNLLIKLGLAGFHPALIGLIIFSFLAGPVFGITLLSTASRSTKEQPVPISIIATTSAPQLPTYTQFIPIEPTGTPKLFFTQTSAFTPTLTSTPTITLTLTITLPAASGASCVPVNNEREIAQVTGITDGDTITVEMNGQTFKLRYIGIDTPETGDPGGYEATEFNRSLVYGKTITLIKDSSEVDRYDRLLRYVFVGDVFVNNELVRAGYATSGSWPPDTSCDSQFSKTYQIAKANMVGLWVPTPTIKPYVAPTKTPDANKAAVVDEGGGNTSSSSTCPNGCSEPPSGCVIKGNINAEGEKIYHVPGGGSYNQTKISPDKGERWFCTEAEAVANGWRKARN